MPDYIPKLLISGTFLGFFTAFLPIIGTSGAIHENISGGRSALIFMAKKDSAIHLIALHNIPENMQIAIIETSAATFPISNICVILKTFGQDCRRVCPSPFYVNGGVLVFQVRKEGGNTGRRYVLTHTSPWKPAQYRHGARWVTLVSVR